MLKGYTNLKGIARNSDLSTLTLLANSVEGMTAEFVNKLPTLDTVKEGAREDKKNFMGIRVLVQK